MTDTTAVTEEGRFFLLLLLHGRLGLWFAPANYHQHTTVVHPQQRGGDYCMRNFTLYTLRDFGSTTRTKGGFLLFAELHLVLKKEIEAARLRCVSRIPICDRRYSVGVESYC
jgi:hypothetical protein